MRTRDFVDGLIDALPAFDEAILQDVTPTSGWILNITGRGKGAPLDYLPEDVRFLPKRLRSVYVFKNEHPKMPVWMIAKRLGLLRKTIYNRLSTSYFIIDRERKAWLKTLPRNQRRREVYKRRASWRRQQEVIRIRSRGIWPDTKASWPPSSKLNCVKDT